MNLPLYVAWRYFFSKKKLKVINIISLISLIGIAITTMALLVVISVFNGFTSVGTKILSSSNPPLLIEAKKSKVFSLDSIPFNKIKSLQKVYAISPVLKENALISFGQSQGLVLMKGIDESYYKINRIDTSIVYGRFSLKSFGTDACVLGIGVAANIGMPNNAERMGAIIQLIVPKREGRISISQEETFNSQDILYSGSFRMDAQMDEDNVFLPIGFVRELLDYDNNEVSSVFIRPKSDNDIKKLKSEIKELVGEDYEVKDIFEQEPIYQKVVKVERLGVYVILSFIIFIATFNVMGSLSLLIMDKKKDILILRSMGATLGSVRSIYFLNGLMLSFVGAVIGLLLGIGVCLVQQQFGIIKMGADILVVDSFPIELRFLDIISIFSLVLSIGAVSVAIMVSRINLIIK
ncbi:MAG: ABC transporter permease [Bacteroidales bacterium]|nr:ABC transporter permease [Bacteroidales bacterium]MDD4685582.1 ABC transporter permease [Bacteroidales bacterium]